MSEELYLLFRYGQTEKEDSGRIESHPAPVDPHYVPIVSRYLEHCLNLTVRLIASLFITALYPILVLEPHKLNSRSNYPELELNTGISS